MCAVVAIAGMVLDTGGADPPEWSVERALRRSASGQDIGLAGNVRLLENHLSAREADPLLRGRLTRLTDDRLGRLGLQRGEPGVADDSGRPCSAVIEGPPRPLRTGRDRGMHPTDRGAVHDPDPR